MERGWGSISARKRFVLHGLGLNVAAFPTADYVSLVLLAPRNLLPLKNVRWAGPNDHPLFWGMKDQWMVNAKAG